MVQIKSISKITIYLMLILAFSSAVHAHLIGGSGFAGGAAHPLSGIDHLLAMIAVGIISVRSGGKAVWIVPAAFLLSMAIGGIIGMLGINISFVEIGIALSAIFLGMAIFLQKRFSLNLTMSFVAASAIFHGHAHGSEIPLMASPVFYAAGFVLSTAILHISGVLLGHYAAKTNLTAKLLRYAGAGIGIAGIYFLMAV